MIRFIKGTVAEIMADAVIIENQGMGYEIKVPTSLLEQVQLEETVKIHTYLQVREDAMALFGFESISQLELFQKLISVSGIGPKAALAILSTLSVHDLMMAIIAQDAKTISKAPGVGAKTASRLIVELKDSVSTEEFLYQDSFSNEHTPIQANGSTQRQDAYLALVELGYDGTTVMKALSTIDQVDELDTQTILKLALKQLSMM